MNVIVAFVFFIFVFIFALLPFFLLYLLSDLLAFLFCRVFGYRRKIVIKNLKLCFPDKSEKEINRLLPKIYRNVSDNILEGIKAFSMTRKQIVKRHKIINPEVLNDFYESKKSIIAVTGHYGNWEWGSLSPGLQTDFKIVGLYKPLSNKLIDMFVRWSRERFGTVLGSIKETSEIFKNHQNEITSFLMAADQSPGKKYLKSAYWINFLGRDTAFLHGPEKYAKTNNYPVIYIDVQRKKRGYYEIELSILAQNPQELEDGEITTRFAQKLESVILSNPANWLWTHNRWKLSR